MSTKSKATMETKENEVKTSTRPTRNVKPVSYNENVGKRAQGAESMADSTDKKKKKVNGDAKVNAPSKKTGKKKADTNGEKSSDNDVEDEEKPMPESRKRKNDVKPVADETSNSKKAPTSRKKKVEETVDEVQVDDSKPTKAGALKATRGKKATNEAVDAEDRSATPDETENDDERPKPTKSKAGVTKGKKATNEAVSVNAEDRSATPDETENERPKPTKSKAGVTKGKKATIQAVSVDAEAENSTPEEMENGEGSSKPIKSKAGTTKPTKGKKATNLAAIESETPDESTATSVTTKPTKGKKAVKESNAAVDDNEVVDASNNKARGGRAKKPSSATGNLSECV